MATATESFIIPKRLSKYMKGWGKLGWKDIYAEHRSVVDKTFETDERITYLARVYSSDILGRAKTECIESLKELVDAFRADNPRNALPKDLDWAAFFWRYDKQAKLEERILAPGELKSAMGDVHAHHAGNISISVAEAYNTLINDRNNETYSS